MAVAAAVAYCDSRSQLVTNLHCLSVLGVGWVCSYSVFIAHCVSAMQLDAPVGWNLFAPHFVGVLVGMKLGTSLGCTEVGTALGLGAPVGTTEGIPIIVGAAEGALVGTTAGVSVGDEVGRKLGGAGGDVGAAVGAKVCAHAYFPTSLSARPSATCSAVVDCASTGEKLRATKHADATDALFDDSLMTQLSHISVLSM